MLKLSEFIQRTKHAVVRICISNPTFHLKQNVSHEASGENVLDSVWPLTTIAAVL